MNPNVENATRINHLINDSNECLLLNITSANGVWPGDNPFKESLPLLVTQLATILTVTRFLYHLLRPLHQPRFISDVLGGILLGPSALGKIALFEDLFPTRNVPSVETYAYLGLIFHMFFVGLEIDQSVVWRISRKAIAFTVSGLVFPFAIGIAFFFLLQSIEKHDQPFASSVQGSLLWSAALAVTSFPIVNMILSDLHLQNTDIGRLSVPIAFVSDMGCCTLIAIVIPFCESRTNAVFVVTTMIAYVLGCLYTLSPILDRIVHHTSKWNNNNYSEHYLCFVLVGVMLSAFATDVIGTHAIVGSFVFGLIVPNKLAVVLLQRVEFFVSALMMPVFFAISGIRVDIFKVDEWKLVVVIVVVLCTVKVISFVPISMVSPIQFKESFCLGLLMNTKGVWAILIVEIGLDKGVLVEDDYAVMMVTLLLMTSLVAPIVANIYKRTNLPIEYKRRTMQEIKTDEELRIMVCIHSFHNVQGMLKLLDVSHATKHNHITVFTLHLVELVGCQSAMLIVHDAHSHRFDDSIYHPDYGYSFETDQIIDAFREFGRKDRNFSIQSLTAISPLPAMHGDICTLAQDKMVAFLILPFHKQAVTTEEDLLKETIESFRNINKNVLHEAPCSVGIYIESGLGAKTSYGNHHIVMVFLGGQDDWEALAYAWRMSKHPRVNLTVIRILEIHTEDPYSNRKNWKQSLGSYDHKQKEIDDDHIDEFRLQTVGKERVDYQEKSLHNEEELVQTLKDIQTRFDLFVVGRREGVPSPLTTGLSSEMNYRELGVIGDWLAKSDSTVGSVLVVQQFIDPENRLNVEDLAVIQSHGRILEIGRWHSPNNE